MTRIFFLINSFTIGGIERAVVDLASNLDRALFEPVVCAVDDFNATTAWPLVRELEQHCIQVLTLGRRPGSGYREAIRTTRRLCRELRRRRIDILHASAIMPDLLAVAAKALRACPYVIRAVNSVQEWGKHARKGRLMNGWVFPAILDAEVPVAETVAQMLRDARRVRGRAQMRVIPYGVDLKRFDMALSRREARLRIGLDPDVALVGILGALRPEKCHDVFLQAARLLMTDGGSPMRFSVIGDGPMRESLERQTADLGLQDAVTFHGTVVGDLPVLVRSLDVLLSTSSFEGLPMNVLEAMASGVPVVATNVGGTPELIRHQETGWLIEPGQPQAAVEGVQAILADPARTACCVAAAERVARRYGLDVVVSAYEMLYTDLMAGPLASAARPAQSQPETTAH